MSMGYVAAGAAGVMLASSMGGEGGGGGDGEAMAGQAALKNAEISEDAWNWWKAKQEELDPQNKEAVQIALDQARTQLDTSRKQNQMADETYEFTKTNFRPIEQRIATEALNYDTPARRDAEAAQAQADVGTATDAARASLARDIVARGGDVNSGNFTASMGGMAVREAALKAGAGNQARKNVETVAAAKLADAANLGRGIATSNTTQTQLGLNAGNSAVNNAQVPITLAGQQAQIMNSVAGTAMSGNNSSGNLGLGLYSAGQKDNSSRDALIGAAGKALGTYAAYTWSDKRMKKDRRPANDEQAMEAVRKTPVEKWKYRDDSEAADDGREHIGPMAQDVLKNMGDRTAPGGKAIDLVDMNGITLAAVKNLDLRLSKVEKKRA